MLRNKNCAFEHKINALLFDCANVFFLSDKFESQRLVVRLAGQLIRVVAGVCSYLVDLEVKSPDDLAGLAQMGQYPGTFQERYDQARN
ncbi:hypothetical protein [Photobacterium atrarenae]|uniref:Uncharacterized protein n=1 Tax=Photobacterium atrarenae TaxID=865757 RepID=A0ABY5GHU4_9GAMM|nr:hypothetical protein [Photobacterium atrarenae]UTV27928.1 hypothetical protein NNL38_00955 [Photobacterium atrarenae]